MRRWKAEHPRWPSTATVLRYFGSWGEALESAGLPVRRLLFDRPLEERVHAAQYLAAEELTQAEIGEQIGVSRSAVGTYLRAGRCRSCRAVIVQSASGLCRRCVRPRSSWTRQEIVDALRRWARAEGVPPTKDEWRPASERWRTAAPEWPSATIVVWVFGSWNDALEAAGFRPRGRTWSSDEIVAALRCWARANDGKAPAYGDWTRAGPDHPGVTVVADRFGSWRSALIAAGFAPRHRRWTRESVETALRAWSRANGGVAPSANGRSEDGVPPYSVVRRHFGSWEAALEAAELTAPRRR